MNNIDKTKTPLFRDRNFFRLSAGALISMVGDQTGYPLVLGTVLAVTRIPRALMLTKYINTVLLGVLSALAF